MHRTSIAVVVINRDDSALAIDGGWSLGATRLDMTTSERFDHETDEGAVGRAPPRPQTMIGAGGHWLHVFPM